ncbi:flagellar filament capping protein FliD [Moorellaceae bacterium AZ2]
MAGMVNRVGGLASGLDIDQIISDLMKAQRLRLDRIKQDKEIWQWRQEDYRSLNSSLLALRNEVFNLRLQGSFMVKTATSADEGIVTATASGGAVPTVYQVKVERLATAATNVSTDTISASSENKIDPSANLLSQLNKLRGGSSFADVLGGETKFSFTINGVEFVFDAATDSLNTIIAKVNATKEAGVTMFYDPVADKVAIATTYTGDRNPGSAQAGGAEIQIDGAFLTEVLFLNEANEQGGTDAKFSINGLELTSHTNSYTVNGVTFNFTGVTPGGLSGTATTVTVAYDVEAAVKAIKDFVDKYNEVIALINAKLNEARYPDYRPLTETEIEEGKLTEKQIDQWQAKARSGILKNDPLLRSILDAMRQVLASVVEGLTDKVTVTVGGQSKTITANSLSVIGITTGPYTENGKLYLDENRLREALQSNPEAVMALFTRSKDEDGSDLPPAERGIAVRLYEAINNGIQRITSQAGTAGALVDNSYIGRLLRDYDRRISDYEERLAKIEDRYWRQFTALETAINRMNMQSMWLAQQFASGGQ